MLVWPGFGAGNASTTTLRGYLRFLGYKVEGWSQGTNGGDVLNLLEALKADLQSRKDDAPVTLVEYASVACGACASWHEETWSTIETEFAKIKITAEISQQ